jgi:hypothetical protein
VHKQLTPLAASCTQYLNASLPPVYRIGVARPDVANEWRNVDGSPVAQVPSMGTPYGHWSWTQPGSADNYTLNCAVGYRDYSFDYYLGGLEPGAVLCFAAKPMACCHRTQPELQLEEYL